MKRAGKKSEDPRRFLTYFDLVARGYFSNRMTLGRHIKKGLFPKPIKLNSHTVRWSVAEVEAWERDPPAPPPPVPLVRLPPVPLIKFPAPIVWRDLRPDQGSTEQQMSESQSLRVLRVIHQLALLVYPYPPDSSPEHPCIPFALGSIANLAANAIAETMRHKTPPPAET